VTLWANANRPGKPGLMKAAASRRTPWTVTERRDDTSRTAGLSGIGLLCVYL